MFKLLKLAYLNNKRQIIVNSSLILLLEIIHIILLYYLNQIRGNLYHGIQNYDVMQIWNSIGGFSGIAFILVLVTGYAGFYINKLSFNLREGLTLYYFNNVYLIRDRKQELLEQRVQEDFRKYGDVFTDISIALLRAGFKLPVFLFVIVSLTKWYTGVGIILAVVSGTWLSRKVSLMLVPLQSEQENNEARFRNNLTRVSFDIIREQFFKINKMFKKLSFTQSGLGQGFALLPFIVLMPSYISKVIDLGAFNQAVNALGNIIDSLSVLIDSRQTIIGLEMVCLRLSFLTDQAPEED